MMDLKKLNAVDYYLIDPRNYEVLDSNRDIEPGLKCFETLGFFEPCWKLGFKCPVRDGKGGYYEIESDGISVRFDAFYGGDKLYEIRAVDRYYSYYRILKKREREGFVDQLTGLYNRRALDRISRKMRKAIEAGHEVWYVLIDLQHLKEVNDRYGHQAGDEMIKTFGIYLRDNLKSADIVVRLGGDEFVIIFIGTSKEGVCKALKRLKDESPYVNFGGEELKLSFSYGMARVTEEGLLGKAYEEADAKMYRNKSISKFLTLFDSLAT